MILIHIGLPKSGSSSIQYFFSANEEQLRACSIDYPAVGRIGVAHRNIAHEIGRGNKIDPAHGNLSDLCEYWRSSSAETMILSSEVFEFAERDAVLRLKGSLSRPRAGERFRIVLIIRELMDLIPSSYGEKIKRGAHTYSFDEFFEGRLQGRRVNYFETASIWADAFGWENISVRLLDRAHLRNGDLIDDFIFKNNLEIPDQLLSGLSRPGIRNATPGWRVLEALRALYDGRHGLSPEHPLARAAGRKKRLWTLPKKSSEIGERFGWNEDRGQYFTRAQAQACIGLNATAIEALNEKLSDPLPPPRDLVERQFQERVCLPDVANIPKQELRRFYEALWFSCSQGKNKNER